MTLKEKAKQLVEKYNMLGKDFTRGVSMKEFSKQCALIAVEFAREEFRNHCAAEIDTIGSPDDHFNTIIQEIEKL